MKEYILTDLIKQYPKEFKYTIREYKNAGWDILNDDSIFAIVHHMIGYDGDEKIAHRMMRLGIADGEYIDKENVIWDAYITDAKWLNINPITQRCICYEFDTEFLNYIQEDGKIAKEYKRPKRKADKYLYRA